MLYENSPLLPKFMWTWSELKAFMNPPINSYLWAGVSAGLGEGLFPEPCVLLLNFDCSFHLYIYLKWRGHLFSEKWLWTQQRCKLWHRRNKSRSCTGANLGSTSNFHVTHSMFPVIPWFLSLLSFYHFIFLIKNLHPHFTCKCFIPHLDHNSSLQTHLPSSPFFPLNLWSDRGML